MNYWWVNHKQTHHHEVGEGYMWSPKRQKEGSKHFSYEFMKHIKPEDVVFSYANSAIIAVGVALTHCYTFPKPIEFGNVGANWGDEGWKVDVKFQKLANPVRTIDHIHALREFLPENKSPIQETTGYANQAYLFKIDKAFALALAHLIGHHTVALVNGGVRLDDHVTDKTIDSHIDEWENRIIDDLASSKVIGQTEKETLIKARRGQGRFREVLLQREPRCRVTKVDKPEHLIASHIKPWRSSNNNERLDGENGFMLTPTIDHLFDKGFMSFSKDGKILLADVADRSSMEKMGVYGDLAPETIGVLSQGQKKYLEWHQDNIFLS